MHVLHRPHLPGAIAITLIAAVLAIVLTLALASGLSDHGFVAASPSRAAARPQVSAARPRPSTSPFTRSPFTSVLSAPVPAPWPHLTGAD